MAPVSLRKEIEPGTYRYLGMRMTGIPWGAIPIGVNAVERLIELDSARVYRIRRRNPENIAVVRYHDLWLVYVRPGFRGYRRAAQQVFRAPLRAVDYDHVLGRRLADDFHFRYVLLCRLAPAVNRGHGRYERPGAERAEASHGYLSARILDKVIGRMPGLIKKEVLSARYDPSAALNRGMTLLQLGRYAWALGMEDEDYVPTLLIPLAHDAGASTN